MDLPQWCIYLILVALVACSAFFSASETAFLSMNKIRMKAMAEEGNGRARLALKISENYDRTLSTILVGNNVVNIAASSLATVLFSIYFPVYGPVISTAVMTLVILVFGEILPKTVAKEKSESISMAIARAMNAVLVLLTPLAAVFLKFQNWVVKRLRHGGGQPYATEEELKYIVDTIESEGVLEKQESELVRSALEFDETAVQEVLIPRVDMAAVDVEDDVGQIVEYVLEEGYSRYPVYEHTTDHIIGLLQAKDVLARLAKGQPVEVRELMRPCIFVHRSKKLSAVLNDLKRTRQHLAVVTDDYGGTQGIVTMEDLLEELVGDIYDEDEEVPQDIVAVGPGIFEVSGDTDAEDFMEKVAGLENEELDCNSVGGWVLDELKHLPEEGETFRWRDWLVTVLEMDDQRIRKVRVEPAAETAAPAEE
ncbi:MAG: hemolysin family protein [Oscillospiraceae bacterium]|nr:hemolysin family protein [Oscillospiraceae bacterium]